MPNFLNIFSTKKKKIVAFRHQWSVDHFDWLCSGAVKGRPELATQFDLGYDTGGSIQLCLWPKGRDDAAAEYVSIGMRKNAGWWVYAKVSISGVTATERVVSGRAEKDLTIGQFQLRSDVLASLKTLENKKLTVLCEGVIYNSKSFVWEENHEIILQLLADVPVRTSHFNFQPPQPRAYFTSSWSIGGIADKLKEPTLKAHWMDVDENTSMAALLSRSFKAGSFEYLSVAVQGVRYPVNRIVAWRVALVNVEGKTLETWYESTKLAVKHIKWNSYFAAKDAVSKYKTLTLQIEILSFKNDTLNDDDNSSRTMENYKTILQHLSTNWKRSALDSSLQSSPSFTVSSFFNLTYFKFLRMITVIDGSDLLVKSLLSTNLAHGQLRVQVKTDQSLEVVAQCSKPIFENLVKVLDLILNKNEQKQNFDEGSCYSTTLLDWTAESKQVKFTIRLADDHNQNQYDLHCTMELMPVQEGEVEDALEEVESTSSSSVEICETKLGSKEQEKTLTSKSIKNESEASPSQDQLTVANLKLESAQEEGDKTEPICNDMAGVQLEDEDSDKLAKSEHDPNATNQQQESASNPDLETLQSWASMFAFGDLEEMQFNMPRWRLEAIGQQAKRYLDQYQASRQATDDEARIKIVQLAKLVKIQAKELLTSRELKSKPVRYVLAEHVKAAGSDI